MRYASVQNAEFHLFCSENRNFLIKTIQKNGAYNTPILREVNCHVEAGFAASSPSGFNDLDFEGRDEE